MLNRKGENYEKGLYGYKSTNRLIKLYSNIGKKIKFLAVFLFIIGTIVSLIWGVLTIKFAIELQSNGNQNIDELVSLKYACFIKGILLIVLGPILAWISTWLLYGFGELVDKSDDTEFNTRLGAERLDKLVRMDEKKIKKLEELLAQVNVSEEELK